MTKENLTVYWGDRYYTSRTQAEGLDGPPSRLYLADEVDELLAKLRAHEPKAPPEPINDQDPCPMRADGYHDFRHEVCDCGCYRNNTFPENREVGQS